MTSTFTLINPATAQPIREIARADVAQTDAAIARAVTAQRGWASLPPVARADALRAFARVVEAHVEELAQLEVQNSGHPIGSARWEASHVAQVLNFYAGAPERLSGQQIPVAGGLDVTFHEPYGVVGIIVPWNFPMTIASWGFAPALAAGNAVVLKPAELTPLTAIRLGELAREAGLPPGLFEVVTGSGSGISITCAQRSTRSSRPSPTTISGRPRRTTGRARTSASVSIRTVTHCHARHAAVSIAPGDSKREGAVGRTVGGVLAGANLT